MISYCVQKTSLLCFEDSKKRGTKVVGLKNVMSAKEIEEGLKSST